jgi:molybdenum cofactor biosynthesis enzyme MoaA
MEGISVEMTSRPLTPEEYYRLPWNLADNAITWLEPTTKCNIYCEGCYRENNPAGHRPLEEVIEELEALKGLRRTDGISIAGGEPLIYPHILELVEYVAAQGWKPIVNSNGQALTPELVRDLRKSGLVGFTFHVDSHQSRPGWKGKTEQELNELRLKLARMVREESRGRVACSFNATIYRDTVDDIPMMTRWAEDHMDIVQTMVFILFRSLNQDPEEWDAFVGNREISPQEIVGSLVYKRDEESSAETDVHTQEVADRIREVSPDYEPCAFLNGTADARTMKWLLSIRVGRNGNALGYLDSKFAELTQTFHHLFFGSYLAYSRPFFLNNAQAIFPAFLFNGSIRRLFGRWLRTPSLWFRSLKIQAVLVIQPVDVLPDGQQDMCDGCPDAILHDGRLVWSCRLDELEKFGGFVRCTPKG